jgi:cadmium resistance protein CadD (predicted permease)
LATTLSKPPLWRIALPLLGLAVALSFVLTYVFGGLIGGLFAFYAILGVLWYAAYKHGATRHSFLDNKAEKSRKQEQRLNEELGKAWTAKLKQALLKAKILSVSDPKFAAEMAALSNEFTKKEKRTILVTVIIWIIAIAIAVAYIAAPAEDRKARIEVFDDSEESVENASDVYTTDSLYEDEAWKDYSDLDTITEDIDISEDIDIPEDDY